MDDETKTAQARAGQQPTAEALALFAEHRATEELFAAQAARWTAHSEAMTGGAGQMLPPDEALALLAEHKETNDLLVSQRARWDAHVETLFGPATRADPMADARIAAYYNGAERAHEVQKEREKKAWERLGKKVKKPAKAQAGKGTKAVQAKREKQVPINPKRSEAMSKDELTTNAAPAAEPATQSAQEADKAKFEQAKRDALANPDKARQSNPGRFALHQAQKDQQAAPPWASGLGGLAGTRAALAQVTPAPQQENMIEQAREVMSAKDSELLAQIQDHSDHIVRGTAGELPGQIKEGRTGKGVIHTMNHELAGEWAADDLTSLLEIESPAVRMRALAEIAKSSSAQQGYREEFAAMAPELAAEVQRAVGSTLENTIEQDLELTAEQAQGQARRLNEVIGTASILMSGQKDTLERDEAAGMAGDDIAALRDITEPNLRMQALLAVAESRHAQAAYREEFDRLAPALVVEVEATVVERFGEEYASKRAAPQLAGDPAREADRIAREQALATAALAQIAANRARDIKEVAAKRGWAENTIEPDEAPVIAPAQQVAAELPAQAILAKPAAAPAVNVKLVPAEVEKAFIHVGDKFYMPKNKERVAFEDHGLKLKTVLSTDNITLAMVQVAHARGWTSIKVSGTPEFCQKAWRDAALLGMAVKGYTPTEMDKADLARRMPAATNVVAQTAAATPAPAPAPAVAPAPVVVNSQAGIYISADDAALLAAAKASLQRQQGTATAPAPAPAAMQDVLVAHGPAKYKHDPDNPDSYYATLANPKGVERTVWGVTLGKAIAESGVKVGDPITLVKNGEEQVTVDAKVKDAAGKVVGVEKIGAVRNEWVVKAHAIATLPPGQVAAAHPDLAGMLSKIDAVAKRAEADGLTEAQRAIVAARTQQNAAKDVERGNAPVQKIRQNVEVKRKSQPQQELAQ